MASVPYLRLCAPAPEPPGAGQLISFEGLFRSHSRYVASIALRILGRDHEVDDVVQDVFLEAMKGLRTLRDAMAVRGWLATITVRCARARLRKRRVRLLLGLDRESRYEDIAAPGANQEERALLSHVYHVLDTMPVDQRIAWTLRHMEGEQLESVAHLCRCSLATAKRRIAAAQETLERTLSDEL